VVEDKRRGRVDRSAVCTERMWCGEEVFTGFERVENNFQIWKVRVFGAFMCFILHAYRATWQIQVHKLNGGAPTYLAVKETPKDIHFETASGRLY